MATPRPPPTQSQAPPTLRTQQHKTEDRYRLSSREVVSDIGLMTTLGGFYY